MSNRSAYTGHGYHCTVCMAITDDPHWQDGKPLCRGCWLDYRDEVVGTIEQEQA